MSEVVRHMTPMEAATWERVVSGIFSSVTTELALALCGPILRPSIIHTHTCWLFLLMLRLAMTGGPESANTWL